MKIRRTKSKGIEVERRGKIAIFRFQDRSLSFYFTESIKVDLREKITDALESGCDRFILSLKQVKCIDSCGVGVVIVANNMIMRESGKLYISDVRPFILKIFDILRISKHLSIFDTEDEAVATAQETP